MRKHLQQHSPARSSLRNATCDDSTAGTCVFRWASIRIVAVQGQSGVRYCGDHNASQLPGPSLPLVRAQCLHACSTCRRRAVRSHCDTGRLSFTVHTPARKAGTGVSVEHSGWAGTAAHALRLDVHICKAHGALPHPTVGILKHLRRARVHMRSGWVEVDSLARCQRPYFATVGL